MQNPTPRSAEEDSVIQSEFTPEELALGNNLVTISWPKDPTLEEVGIAKDFVRLDHLSLHTLGPRSAERLEIRLLLFNVAVMLQNRQPQAARELLSHAEAVYVQHVQAKHRLRYLGGMVAGILLMLAFAMLLFKLLNAPAAIIPVSLLPLLLLFAGMGSITSVLTRLASIDLYDETNLRVIFVSGMAKPVTGTFLALVVYLVLALRIVEFHFGDTGQPTPPGLFLIAAFFSGFSERFANDILAKFTGAGTSEAKYTKPTDESTHRKGKEEHQ